MKIALTTRLCERCSVCKCSHSSQFRCVCEMRVWVCLNRKRKMNEKLGSAHKIFVYLSFRQRKNTFPPLAIVCFACVCVYNSEFIRRSCVCVCMRGVFKITTYYDDDCVCACSKMFRNLQFTRSTNSIEFYVYLIREPVMMIICTKNTVSHIHKGHSQNSLLSLSHSRILALCLFAPFVFTFSWNSCSTIL